MSAVIETGKMSLWARYLSPGWYWAALVSLLAWAVIFVAIPPSRQDFPLGDDWAFAHGAIWFAGGQGIHYSRWASMPQLGQWLWSWPFLEVIGLKHVALRLSVIVLSWLGLAAFYDLLRLEKVPSWMAAFSACVLALNPLFFVSQGTYMTDVPALSFALLSLCFYSRALDGKNLRWLLAAVIMAIFAVITRQTMLAVTLAAGVLVLRNQEIRRKPVWILAVIVPAAVCLYTTWWFSRRPDVLPMEPEFFNMRQLEFRSYLGLHWCGLVVLPLFGFLARQWNWRFFLFFLALMTGAAGYYYSFGGDSPDGRMFPYCGGMLTLWGTSSGHLIAGQPDILLTPPVRLALTLLGCVGAAGILSALVETIRSREKWGMLLLFTLAQFLVLLTLPYMMDRYFEVLFPGALFLVASRCSGTGSGWLAGLAAVALSGLVSVVLFHDWLAWNSARWELGRQAITIRNIQPDDIEGGFEWDGWFGSADPARPLPDSNLVAPGGRRASLTLLFSHYYFPEVTGKYALAFTIPADSTVVAACPYDRWLPAAKKEFLLVQQKP